MVNVEVSATGDLVRKLPEDSDDRARDGVAGNNDGHLAELGLPETIDVDVDGV